jgi:hypothetical protein
MVIELNEEDTSKKNNTKRNGEKIKIEVIQPDRLTRKIMIIGEKK